MAYQIEVKNNYGITCNYWKISHIEKDFISETASLILCGFISKESSELKNDCLDKRYITIRPADFQKVFGSEYIEKEGMNDRKALYLFIKDSFKEYKTATLS